MAVLMYMSSIPIASPCRVHFNRRWLRQAILIPGIVFFSMTREGSLVPPGQWGCIQSWWARMIPGLKRTSACPAWQTFLIS